jgi:hypothetical protein
MVGKIPAGTCNAGAVRARRMKAHLRGLVHQGFAIWTETIVRVAEQMIECRFGMLKGAGAAFDEHRQIAWHQSRRQLRRLPFVLALPEELRVSESQVGDQFPAQSANSLVWTEHDNLHRFAPPCTQAYRDAIRPSRSNTG